MSTLKSKNKILVLFCGGTIVMQKRANGSFSPPSKEDAIELLISLEPRIFQEIDIQVQYLFNVDSSNLLPDNWNEIAETIYKSYESYDGFVVIQGTDTMAFTSSALSFALQDLGKPVVFTGAQISGRYLESDARSNFVNAIYLATKNISGVLLLFDKHIFQGNRVSKVSHTHLKGFSSIKAPLFGVIETKMRISKKAPTRHSRYPKLSLGFDSKIQVEHLFPGVSLDCFIPTLGKDLQAVILVAFGTGNISKTLFPFLKEAKKKQVPVVVRSQCTEGITDLGAYELGSEALSCGVIQSYDMSFESTITKLMWVLDKKIPYDNFAEVFYKDLAGEIEGEEIL
jgi:L-asparaginase